MTRHIGIVGCSAEGAALFYRTICLEALELMGEHSHPQITLNSIPMAEHMRHIERDDWEGVACSAEGAALCYRTICLEALELMGEHNHPQITLNSRQIV